MEALTNTQDQTINTNLAVGIGRFGGAWANISDLITGGSGVSMTDKTYLKEVGA